MTPDLINACFEGFAAVVSSLNLRAILRDKAVQGVSPWPVVFFTTWGWWNLFFYSNLEQWLSTIAAVPICVINMLWLYYYWRFTYNER